MKALVVGDKDYERTPVANMVRQLGYVVTEMPDGIPAWELFSRTHFDIIISDFLMPGMTGFELCKKVRLAPHQDYTYFIIISSRQEAKNLLEGFQAGVDDYLPKPVDPVELECRLISASRVTKIHRELAQSNHQLLMLSNELKTESRRDALTGVGNRLRFKDDVTQLFKNQKPQKEPYYVALCDIDNFKLYNDTYGHLEGDRVLKTVAKILDERSAAKNLCYRFGGEEFLLLFADSSREDSLQLAHRLKEAVAELNILHERNAPHGKVTLSFGLAPLNATVFEELDACLKRADEAMYFSKENGRNQVADTETLAASS